MGIAERKEREKEIRREQIMTAATQLFMSKGFNSTKIEEIAKKAELSPALIYQYFKNKDDLFATLHLVDLEHLNRIIKKKISDKKLPAEQKLLQIKDAFYENYIAHPTLVKNIMHVQLEDTLPNVSSEVAKKLSAEGKKAQRALSEVFSEGVRNKIFKPRNPIAVADALWAIFTGLVVWEGAKMKSNPEKDFLKPTLDMAFEVFCNGLKS